MGLRARAEGSLQWYIDADHEQHYFSLYETRTDLHPRLRDFAVFDIVANNTDRKSGHVLIDADEMLWGIDHGLCFAEDFKLRTVVWEFGGEPLAEHWLQPLQHLADGAPPAVAELLDEQETAAMCLRAAELLHRGHLPTDPTGRRYPWPLV